MYTSNVLKCLKKIHCSKNSNNCDIPDNPCINYSIFPIAYINLILKEICTFSYRALIPFENFFLLYKNKKIKYLIFYCATKLIIMDTKYKQERKMMQIG